MTDEDAPPRTWLFWVLPPVLCGLVMAAHCVLHVPTGEMELRQSKSKSKPQPKKSRKKKAKAKAKKARTP